VLIGNSSGAALALDFALAHPQMVQALVLLGPVVHGMPTSEYFSERGSHNSAPLQRGDIDGAAKAWSNDRFLIAGDDQRARGKLYDFLRNNPQNLKVSGEFERRPSPPTVSRLHEIQAPTLILVGEADIGDVFAYAGAIQAALPLASFEIWKGTGHLIQLQNPRRLVSRFRDFLALAERREVNLPAPVLDRYVGAYALSKSSVRILRTEGRLILAIPGQPYYRLFAAPAASWSFLGNRTV
jgi:pimeloyl-ACP methyl ester carboxylesterase